MRRFSLSVFVCALRRFCSARLVSLTLPARRRRSQTSRFASRSADISVERLETRALLSGTPMVELPSVQSIEFASPAGPEATGPTVSYTFTFSEAVTGVDASDFQVVKNGPVSDSTVSVSPVSDSVYTVTVTGIQGNGELSLKLVDDGSIRDLSGHGLVRPDAAATFQSLPSIITDSRPIAVTEGDLNGDGNADLVFAKFSNGTVNVLLGNGDGTFQPEQSFSTGDQPGPLSLADVNGDGKLDVLTTNFATDTLSVLLGNGDGTLHTAQTFSVGAAPYGIVVADLNGDGNSDVAVGNYGSNNVSVLLGNGDGTFQPQQSLNIDDGPVSLAAEDFNDDGIIDLAVSSSRGQTVSLSLGNGDGTFQPPLVYLSGTRPYAIVASDLNGDGKPDLAVTSLSGANVSILLGNGDGTFQSPLEFAAGDTPNSLSVGDLNGDGKPDLVATNAHSQSISLLRGNGDGTFQAPTTLPVGDRPTSVVIGDLNGDGKPDLAVTSIDSNTLNLFTNTMSGSVTGPAYSIDNGSDAPTVAISSVESTYGSPTAQISGQLLAPTAIPNGEVIQISLAGQTQSVTLDSDGQFSASFDTSTLNVGNYPIQVFYAGDDTLQPASIMNTSLALVVVAATPHVVAVNAGGVFNNQPVTTTFSAVGIHGEEVSGTATYTYYNGSSATGTPLTTVPIRARTYTVVATFTSNDPNYANATSDPVTFVITKATPSFHWWVLGGTYNGSEFPATVYVLGVDGQPIRGNPILTYYSGDSASGPGSTTAPTDAGIYTVVATYVGGDSSYLVATSDPITFGIAVATPTIAVTAMSRDADGTPIEPTAIVTGVDGTEVSGSTTFTYYAGYEATGTGTTTPPSNPGAYTVVAQFLTSDSNYTNIQSDPVIFTLYGTLTVPTVTVSANDGVYDGSPHEATVAVSVDGEPIDETAELMYYPGTDTSETGSPYAPVDAGTYTVVAYFASSTGNYRNAISEPVTFTITPATPIVAMTNSAFVYNGTPFSASAHVFGIPTGEATSTVAGTISYRYYVGMSAEGPSTSTPPTNANWYTVVADFTSSDGNYTDASSTPTGLRIVPAAPVLVATRASGSFSGSPFSATLNATGIDGSPIQGEPSFVYYPGIDLSGEGTVTPPTNVGTYTVHAIFRSLDGNYLNGSASPVTFSITQAVPGLSMNVTDGTYNGNPFPATATAVGATGAGVSGTTTLTYYNGSTVNGTGTSTAPTSAGTYTVVASFVSADANYQNDSTAPMTFTISKATPTVVVSRASGTYSGTSFEASATVTGVGGMPVLGTTTLTYYNGSTASGNARSTVPINAGTYTVVASFSGNPNYNDVSSSPVTFTISKVTPTVVATDPGGTYGYFPYAAETTVTGIGGVTVNGTTTLTYYIGTFVYGSGTTTPPANAGTYTVVASFVSGNANYNNASSSPVTFTIAKATPNLTLTNSGATYTSRQVPATLEVRGVINELLSGTTTLTYYAGSSATGTGTSTPPINAGTYTVVANFTSQEPNYTNATATLTYTINKVTPPIYVGRPSGTYDGNAFVAVAEVPNIAYVSHYVPANGTTSITYYVGNSVNGTVSTTAPVNAGTYTFVASFTSADPNYNDTASNPVTFTIAPATPTIVATRSSGAYTGGPFTATATATGVGGATVNGVATFTYYTGSTVAGTGTTTAPTNVGTYTVVASFTSDDTNYANASSAPVTFTITKSTPTVVASNPGGTYNGNPFSASAIVTGAGGAVVSGTTTFTYYTGNTVAGSGTITAPTNVGTYTVVASFTSSDTNYNGGSSNPVTFTIATATPLVTVNIANGPYTGNRFNASATVTGAGGVAVSGTTRITYYSGSTVSGTGSSTAPSTVGTYTVVASFASSDANYRNSTSDPVTFKIYAAPVRMTFNPSLPTTITAGDSTGTIKVQLLDGGGNVVTNDNVTPLSLTVNGVVVATATASNGTVTFSGLVLTTAGTATIAVSSPSLPQATARITVKPASPSKLVFTAQPQESDGSNSIVAGKTLVAIKVTVLDAYGNLATTSNSPISLAVDNIAGGPSGVTTLRVTPVNGVAQFNGIVIRTTGTYSLTAMDSTNSLDVTSNTFQVTPAVAAKLALVTTLPSTLTLNGTTPPIVVMVQDQYGNVLTNGSSATLTLKLNTIVVTATQSNSNGIYTFAGLVLKNKGNNTIVVTSPGLGQIVINIAVS